MSSKERLASLPPSDQLTFQFKRKKRNWEQQHLDIDLTFWANTFRETHNLNCNSHANYYVYGYKDDDLRHLTDYVDVEKQDVVSAKQVLNARLIAAKALIAGQVDKVVIVYGDSDKVEDNSRNAAFDIGGSPLYPHHPDLQFFPKKAYPEPLAGTYDWEPLDDDTRQQILIKAICKLREEGKHIRSTAKHEFNSTRRSSRKLKHQLKLEQYRDIESSPNYSPSIPLQISPDSILPQAKIEYLVFENSRAGQRYGKSTPDYYPDSFQTNHPDYLREVTIDAGSFLRRAYLLSPPDTKGHRIVIEQQFSGFFTEKQVHQSRILDHQIPSDKAYIDCKDNLGDFFQDRLVDEPIIAFFPFTLPILEKISTEEIT